MVIIKEIRLTYWELNKNRYVYTFPWYDKKFDNEQEAIESGFHINKVKSISIIRSNYYGLDLKTIDIWYNVAKEFYSDLKEIDVRIVNFGGSHYQHTFGIIFDTPGDGLSVPYGWNKIEKLEVLL